MIDYYFKKQILIKIKQYHENYQNLKFAKITLKKLQERNYYIFLFQLNKLILNYTIFQTSYDKNHN